MFPKGSSRLTATTTLSTPLPSSSTAISTSLRLQTGSASSTQCMQSAGENTMQYRARANILAQDDIKMSNTKRIEWPEKANQST